MRVSLLLGLLILVLADVTGQLWRIERSHPAMGTLFHITLYAADTLAAERACVLAFARIDSLEAQMSDYRNDSELSRLSNTTEWSPVSRDLWQVMRLAQCISSHSKGAFDVTIGPLSKLWRRAFRQQQFPDSERLASARSRVNYRCLQLHRRQYKLRLRRPGMQLDLGGIAKGYALDAAYQILQQHGIDKVLLDGGGDILVGASPARATGWTVALPSDNPANIPKLVLTHRAIATSGATYRYLEWQGQRYSHLIDPKTGLGVQHPHQVTVAAPCAALADALASACSVLDKNKGKRLVDRFPGCSVTYH